MFFNANAAQKINTLCKVYLTIRKKASEILKEYDDVNYLEEPSIDVEAIAKRVGIVGIFPVPPEEIHYYHATLEEIEKDKFIIKVNEVDSEEERRFSIAHEIEHYLQKKAGMRDKADVFRDSDYDKKVNAIKKADMFKKPDELAARYSISSNNHKKAVRKVKKMKGSKPVASYIAETVSKKIGKTVSLKQAYRELAKVFIETRLKTKIRKGSNEQILLSFINELYNEEMADYFAANLLVPTERFILWDDKLDKKIAEAFKVPKACIKKRRNEVKNELYFISKKPLSFGDKLSK